MARDEDTSTETYAHGTCGACRHGAEPIVTTGMAGRGLVQCAFLPPWRYPSKLANCAVRPERFEARA